jgi:ribosomal protein S12 methylthiotransferase accessory factor
MKYTIGILGEGILARSTATVLEEHFSICSIPENRKNVDWESIDLLLVLNDHWHPSIHREIQTLSVVPWLRCFIGFGEAMIGPLIQPNGNPCFHCADRRILMGGNDRKEMWEIYQHLSQQATAKTDPWLSIHAVNHITNILLNEINKIVDTQSSLQEELIIIHLPTLQTTSEKIIADPLCSICVSLPSDTAELAQISLQSNPKTETYSFRKHPFEHWRHTLKKDYYGNRTGVFNGNIHDYLAPFAAASVKLPLYGGSEATAGRTHRFGDSEITAIFEGLERSCGIAPRSKRTIIYDSYHNISDLALHPEKVGTHSNEQYNTSHFPFRAFDPHQKMNWVWGYSFGQEQPILVPELLAYYSLGDDGKGFVYETSNGCALGGSIEEAIFHGILEVFERDAFLITWYAQLPLTRIDPLSASDRELHLMLDRIHTVAGYEIHLFDATMEHQIPSIFAIARNKKETGFHLICAAGTHFDPIKATKNAIHELAGMMLTLDAKAEQQRTKYRNMIDKPHLVRQMPDHSMLYSIPETEPRLHFLLKQDERIQTYQQMSQPPISETDLTDDLQYLIQTCKNIGLDVIVINQTTTELERNDLHCVKVIIPGMLPMTFGHHLTRLTGLPRVLQIPKKLGYVKSELSLDQLNPHPHPFP